jgi:long-chain fatty acid transport protein
MLHSFFNKTKSCLLAAAFAAPLMLGATNANAAGFYLQEQSVSGLGAAFAGQAAMPRDASIMYFNPAGMALLDRAQLNVGVHVIAPNVDMRDTGTTLNPGFVFAPGGSVGNNDGGSSTDATPIPNFYMAAPVSDDGRLWAGFGVSVPFGFGSEYDKDFFARFDSTKSVLKTIDFQPTIAYKANDKLSFGGGIIVQYADASLSSRTPIPTGTVPPIAVIQRDQRLTGSDISLGYNLGFTYDFTPETRLGVSYRSEINHTLEGNISLNGFFDVGGRADLDLPGIASFAVAHKFTDRLTGLAQANWFGWSSFSEIQAVRDDGVATPSVVQNYQNTWAFSVGADYELNEDWTLRAGYQFDETPTTDEFRTTRTPDGDRHWYAAGLTYNVNDKWSLDLSGTYIDVEEEAINLQRGAGANVVNVRAETDNAHVLIGAVAVNYKF